MGRWGDGVMGKVTNSSFLLFLPQIVAIDIVEMPNLL